MSVCLPFSQLLLAGLLSVSSLHLLLPVLVSMMLAPWRLTWDFLGMQAQWLSSLRCRTVAESYCAIVSSPHLYTAVCEWSAQHTIWLVTRPLAEFLIAVFN